MKTEMSFSAANTDETIFLIYEKRAGRSLFNAILKFECLHKFLELMCSNGVVV